MFESKSGPLSPPEVIARFDEMFERHYPSKTPESSALDECVDYANRLRAAGVPTQLRIVPAGFHGFDVVGPQTSVVRQFRADQLAAMRQPLAS
jgi:acetyl esterase/lipase